MQRTLPLLLSLLVAACAAAPAPDASPQSGVSSPSASASAPAASGAAFAPQVDDSEIAGKQSCGPFTTVDLAEGDQPLLEDRLAVRFFAGAERVGDADSGKLELEREGWRLFVGAREVYARGGDDFAQAAARSATFKGRYDPVTLRSRGGDRRVIAGLLRDPSGGEGKLRSDASTSPRGEMVALAHGWLLDDDRNVLDVAVFSSPIPVDDLPRCRRFAERLLAEVAPGKRRLRYGADGPQTKEISFARFRYTLGPDWILSGGEGIHDFSHIRFKKRGVFPATGADLQLGLDAFPGEWASPGVEEGQRAGTVLQTPFTWRLTKDAESGLVGAWGIANSKSGRDKVVASLWATSALDRDDAVRFAQSIELVP